MSGDGFDSLLEHLVPGSGRGGMNDGDAPPFPKGLGLEPLGVLGRGGVGWVYRARDPVLGREVAVKISRPDGGEAARKALLQEAQVTAGLEHPAILPVHRVFAAEGLLCVEFRLAPTTTLAALLADIQGSTAPRWPLSTRLRQLRRVIGAVGLAHERGIFHGDLHPSNIAIGASGEPYVMDWGGLEHQPGRFSGLANYASPEQLHGEPATAASDVYGLGVLAWELCTLRQMRPRRPGENLGEYINRWRDAPVTRPTGFVADLDPALDQLVVDALEPDPTTRLTTSTLRERLEEIVTGHAEEARRKALARSLLHTSRHSLGVSRELENRIAQEQQVAAVLRAKVPGHAPVDQKRALWEAEDRVDELLREEEDVWLQAVERATVAATLVPRDPEPREMQATLWWEGMRRFEAREDPIWPALCEKRVRAYDVGQYTSILASPSHVTLATTAPDATIAIARFEEADRRLFPRLLDELEAPLERLPLPPGSYLLTVTAPGFVEARYPVFLGRMEHHEGKVRLYTAEQVGEGWVYLPGGPFRMGGDKGARQPLDPCVPFVGDRFIQRTCVRSEDWLTYLNAIDIEEARERAPGEAGLFGGGRGFWAHDGRRWSFPEGWDPDWPVLAVGMNDIEAYAAWLSEKEGRTVRLPTEEEWEKAARGVDGRSYPWGNGFDPTYAHMRRSAPGAPVLAPAGSYPVDCSVYGAMDMAGSMREITSSLFDTGQMVVRGGNFGDDADDLRCACRSGAQPTLRSSWLSFRLITEMPRSRR
jgi:serine/threonine-protein kinase